MKLTSTRVFAKKIINYVANDYSFSRGTVLSSRRLYNSTLEESRVDVDGIKINYVKAGCGPKPIFCLPGALGSIWSDFKPQVEGLDKSKFTIIAWDPPGYGNSRPPNRDFPRDFFHRDADWAVRFMQTLSIGKFSMLGWSDGGITAMIAAANNPEQVDKLVIWGANSYVTEEEAKIYENMRDISKWSERMKAPLIKLYGEEGLTTMWNQWTDALVGIYKNQNGDICKGCLSKITCPTLIVHGNKDAMVASEHPEYLLKHIPHSKLHRFEDGKHNLHLRYADEFNNLVTEFLSK
ncbi:valacyclovir hydrolase [Cryptotermes secundus]|uniref:valacyclovir hydrolase n=1 Tax=Cryptotermes secundus TaxID=105785 RepID=UPI001454C7BD|nr:valacyclovir hydrolase [Cryptotermes secundus]